MHADNVWSTDSYAEEKKRQVTESVNSWLNQARLEWARDTDTHRSRAGGHGRWHHQHLMNHLLKPPLARLIQNGFTGEAKAGEARKTGFSWLLVYFNPGLQNGFTL